MLLEREELMRETLAMCALLQHSGDEGKSNCDLDLNFRWNARSGAFERFPGTVVSLPSSY